MAFLLREGAGTREDCGVGDEPHDARKKDAPFRGPIVGFDPKHVAALSPEEQERFNNEFLFDPSRGPYRTEGRVMTALRAIARWLRV